MPGKSIMMKAILFGASLLSASFACQGQALIDTKDAFDSIHEQARSTLPDTPIAESFFTIAEARAASGNSSFNNIGQLANYLADDYSLHVRLQTEVAKPYCKKKGEDIGPFLDALDRANTREAGIVAKIYARLGISYEPVWVTLKDSASGAAEGLIHRIALATGTTEETVCAHLQKNPVESAQVLSYSNVRSSRSEILRTISP
jgi:hypothetical protein